MKKIMHFNFIQIETLNDFHVGILSDPYKIPIITTNILR